MDNAIKVLDHGHVRLVEYMGDDPFIGSGTTGKVALENGRNFIGSEISEKYCAIADKRISEIGVQL